MAIDYKVLLNDPDTHIVTVRWTDGDSFRDEAFDLNAVIPGAAYTFATMGLPFDYGAAYTYLGNKLDTMKADPNRSVKPPLWPAGVVFQQIADTTPEAYRTQPVVAPVADPEATTGS